MLNVNFMRSCRPDELMRTPQAARFKPPARLKALPQGYPAIRTGSAVMPWMKLE
jgi:hypothetical protein